MQLILVTHRLEEITPNITHILCLKNGKIFAQGEYPEALRKIDLDRLYGRVVNNSLFLNGMEEERKNRDEKSSVPLVEMRNTTVKYEKKHVLNDFNWTVKDGENWGVVGPNGAGKTTVLSLIVGDNLQAYANDIYLFGRRKGSGESIWEIKKKIGMISSEVQVHYRKQIRTQDVIVSGFFDSIGLYRYATPDQLSEANSWMEKLGIAHLRDRRFDRLSDGEKRLVLLARSMVKHPLLLILDEPCQGLDPANRDIILELIDHIGRSSTTNLIYVTHNADEILPCISHILHLNRYPEPPVITKVPDTP